MYFGLYQTAAEQIPSASCFQDRTYLSFDFEPYLTIFLNCRTGKPKITGRSSDGELLSADNTPAGRRVFN
jgi:hypothetical protein